MAQVVASGPWFTDTTHWIAEWSGPKGRKALNAKLIEAGLPFPQPLFRIVEEYLKKSDQCGLAELEKSVGKTRLFVELGAYGAEPEVPEWIENTLQRDLNPTQKDPEQAFFKEEFRETALKSVRRALKEDFTAAYRGEKLYSAMKSIKQTCPNEIADQIFHTIAWWDQKDELEEIFAKSEVETPFMREMLEAYSPKKVTDFFSLFYEPPGMTPNKILRLVNGETARYDDRTGRVVRACGDRISDGGFWTLFPRGVLKRFDGPKFLTKSPDDDLCPRGFDMPDFPIIAYCSLVRHAVEKERGQKQKSHIATYCPRYTRWSPYAVVHIQSDADKIVISISDDPPDEHVMDGIMPIRSIGSFPLQGR